MLHNPLFTIRSASRATLHRLRNHWKIDSNCYLSWHCFSTPPKKAISDQKCSDLATTWLQLRPNIPPSWCLFGAPNRAIIDPGPHLACQDPPALQNDHPELKNDLPAPSKTITKTEKAPPKLQITSPQSRPPTNKQRGRRQGRSLEIILYYIMLNYDTIYYKVKYMIS